MSHTDARCASSEAEARLHRRSRAARGMLIICAFSFLPRPRVARAPRMMAGKGAGSAAGGGGDLAGGGDEERNAQLASLRKMFDTYAESARMLLWTMPNELGLMPNRLAPFRMGSNP